MRSSRAALLLVVLLAPAARADEALGIQLVREAQARLHAGDPDGALELLEKARTEWAGSPVVACTRGDALIAAGRPQEALAEYDRALNGPEAHHAHFNRAVAQDSAGEQLLQQAGVPADVAALPEGPQPAMLQALEQARPLLQGARDDFLDALDLQDEPAARESVGALNRRLDALAQIEDELRKRAEEEQQQQDENKDQDQNQDQNKDQPQDQPQDQPNPDQQDPDQQDPDQQQPNPEGQPPEDQQPPPDQPEQDQQDPQGQEEQPQEQPPPEQQQPGTPARELSDEEVQRLLDKLAQLEAEARERQKAREMASHRAVEKDW